MGDQLLPFPLTERSVHLCVDMQRIFSAGAWPTPWMNRVLPVAAALAGRHPERTVFTRFIPPERPDQMPGMWHRYYSRWRIATRECLDLQLLELMPPLAALCPPPTVIDKTRYSVLAEPKLIEHLRQHEADALIVSGSETDVCVLATEHPGAQAGPHQEAQHSICGGGLLGLRAEAEMHQGRAPLCATSPL